MLSPPAEVTAETLAVVLAREWPIRIDSLTYRPVGFGSHHWAVVDDTGARWFLTVDDLAGRRHHRDEPGDAAYQRLWTSLVTARELRAHGLGFVVAPVDTRSGEPLARIDERFVAALYPFVDGTSFGWGDFSGPDHRRALLDLVAAVHTAPAAAGRYARSDDFTVPGRDEVAAALAGETTPPATGPYAEPTARLLTTHATAVAGLLARYDELVAAARALPARMVLTHGEPHPGNAMLTGGGWSLIDWDTALRAHPERDLWHLDPGDGSILAEYADRTGVTPLPAMVELHRLRWDIADLAIVVSQFRRPHPGDANDDESWHIVRSLVESLATQG
jgi:spectinomycin phosphotransferase/16S rRNA (guanine(1405)-N(7))-methyltransferase